MSGVILDGDPQTPKRLNDLARHQLILKLLEDIRADMIVCELEGWDKMEFLNMIRDTVNGLGERAE